MFVVLLAIVASYLYFFVIKPKTPNLPEINSTSKTSSFVGGPPIENVITTKNSLTRYPVAALIQDTDIWILNSDHTKELLVSSGSQIKKTKIARDGSIFWLDENGVLWKKPKADPALVLAGAVGQLEFDLYQSSVTDRIKKYISNCESWRSKMTEYDKIQCAAEAEKFNNLGKVADFHLSPDEVHIAYEVIKNYTSCCADLTPRTPVYAIWIMKNDASEKAETERSIGGNLTNFEGWIPGKNAFLFSHTYPDASISHSLFYEVGTDGKNPKIYTEIFKFFSKNNDEINPNLASSNDIDAVTLHIGEEPVYNHLGDRVAYINWGFLNDATSTFIRLKNLKTGIAKTILDPVDLRFGTAASIIGWAIDDSIFAVKGLNNVFVFDKDGQLLYKERIDIVRDFLDSYISISPNNRWIALSYLGKEYATKVFILDLNNKTLKKIKDADLLDPTLEIRISDQFFARDNIFYYMIYPKDNISAKQLWSINAETFEQKWLMDNISDAVAIP